MLGSTAVAFVGFPILAPLAVASDVVRFRFRLPTLRVYLFLLQYLFNDSAEIVAAPFLWLGRAPTGAYERIQQWSADLLVKRAHQILGITLDLDRRSLSEIAPGPVIVIARHASVFDATLPSLLVSEAGVTTRGLIMAEMLADPGFDIFYGRLGWKFIPRDDGPNALRQVAQLADGADEKTALVIFPEGRVFSKAALRRSLERLEESAPERARRMSGLRHSLPPRPGGVTALLAAQPEADVVLVSHTGLDKHGTLAELAKVVPLDSQVSVTARRIKRRDIPDTPAKQTVWLDELWLDQDSTIGQTKKATS